MKFLPFLIALAIAAGLTACGQSNAPPKKLDRNATTNDAVAAHKRLDAGAEALEALTEHAASAPIASLESEATVAAAAAAACRQDLTDVQASEMGGIIQRIGEFRFGHDRTALALNAVEGYRILVSAQVRGATDIPLEVAMLDYAGFRYQASVQAQTPLWIEARLALDIADAQWKAVSERISDTPLKSAFEGDLAAMRDALKASDLAAARRVAAVELDRVDDLEKYFAKARGR